MKMCSWHLDLSIVCYGVLSSGVPHYNIILTGLTREFCHILHQEYLIWYKALPQILFDILSLDPSYT